MGFHLNEHLALEMERILFDIFVDVPIILLKQLVNYDSDFWVSAKGPVYLGKAVLGELAH